MGKQTGLTARIVLLVSLLLIVQGVIYFIAIIASGAELTGILLFTGIVVLYHAALGAGLIASKGLFVRDESGNTLSGIGTANTLTLFRISSIPTLSWLFLSSGIGIGIVPLVFLAAVFTTDFLDGFLARAFKEVSKIGKYLDSVSDYLLLIAASIVFFLRQIIPLWLFALITARMVLVGLSVVMVSLLKKKAVYTISFLGKLAVFSTMTLFVLEIVPIVFTLPSFSTTILTVAEYTTGAILGLSLVEKVVLVIRETASGPGNTR